MAILACHAKSQINRHCYYFKKDRKISVFIAWVVWRIKEGTVLYVISHFTWHFSSMFNRLINVPLVSKFSHNNSRILKKKKKNPSMVAHHQILEYSIIMHQIIHSFKIDTSWLLNLLKLLLLVLLIYGNHYLMFYNNMEQKTNLCVR